jgi:hypothetical protein
MIASGPLSVVFGRGSASGLGRVWPDQWAKRDPTNRNIGRNATPATARNCTAKSASPSASDADLLPLARCCG